jgi:hypothetical protein
MRLEIPTSIQEFLENAELSDYFDYPENGSLVVSTNDGDSLTLSGEDAAKVLCSESAVKEFIDLIEKQDDFSDLSECVLKLKKFRTTADVSTALEAAFAFVE